MLVGHTGIVLSTMGVLTILVQVVIPLVVGLVTKVSTKSAWKAILLIVLTAANQFFTGWLAAGSHFAWQSYLVNVIGGVVVSIAFHYGIFKPTGATAQVQTSGVTDAKTIDSTATALSQTPTTTPPAA